MIFLSPGATIGIIGGGQLGRMSAIAAARLGFFAHIFTPEAGAPGSQVSATTTVADYTDHDALTRFAATVDVVTFEFENVPAPSLDLLASLKPVHPSPEILRISQDRLLEKQFLNGIGIPTAPWSAIHAPADLEGILFPGILKTTRLGYDGKGQALVSTPAEAAAAFEAHGCPQPVRRCRQF
jgi:5-(carboxyamino)imidazole ribonucleotide synthase